MYIYNFNNILIKIYIILIMYIYNSNNLVLYFLVVFDLIAKTMFYLFYEPNIDCTMEDMYSMFNMYITITFNLFVWFLW